jgi:ectoine hydroxylase-related dioxygenase (phytanoyl-CoA dioxygenase family)
LDDCEVENGCLFIRPRSHLACSNYIHIPGLEPDVENTISSYDTDDTCNVVNATELMLENGNAAITKEVSWSALKDIPLLVSAGSAVIMTDVVEHASGANRTQYARRAWMPQFSCHPIVWRETPEAPVSLAVPLNKP